MTVILFGGGSVTPPPPPPPVIPGDSPVPPGAPTLKSFAAAVARSLRPLLEGDREHGYAATHLLAGTCEPFQEVDDLVRDTDERPGWAIVLDVGNAPPKVLPWLAQFVGVTIPPWMTDVQQQRDFIKATGGFRRGSPGALVSAAQQYLTGAKRVDLLERFNSPYRLRVVTYAEETPDPDAVRSALMAQKPAGLVLEHIVYGGQSYFTMEQHGTYDDVKSMFDDYAEVRQNQP